MANVSYEQKGQHDCAHHKFREICFLVTRVSSYLKLLCGALQREEWSCLERQLRKNPPCRAKTRGASFKGNAASSKANEISEDRAEREQSRNRADSCQSAIELRPLW